MAIPGKLSWTTALLSLLTPAIAAAASSPSFVPLGEVADAPAGFVELCARDLSLCQAGLPGTPPVAAIPAATPSVMTGHGTGAILATRAVGTPVPPTAAATGDGPRLALLRRINAAVNAQVIQLPDSVTAGVDERWDRPGEVGRPAGDCEDIAIEKRARLLEAGFAPDRLFFAVVYRTGFGLHTVLVARLDDGDEVLDSAERDVKPWTRTRYVWLRAQAPGAPMRWQRVTMPGRPARA